MIELKKKEEILSMSIEDIEEYLKYITCETNKYIDTVEEDGNTLIIEDFAWLIDLNRICAYVSGVKEAYNAVGII
jgi:hypothetical protein